MFSIRNWNWKYKFWNESKQLNWTKRDDWPENEKNSAVEVLVASWMTYLKFYYLSRIFTHPWLTGQVLVCYPVYLCPPPRNFFVFIISIITLKPLIVITKPWKTRHWMWIVFGFNYVGNTDYTKVLILGDHKNAYQRWN